MHLYCCQIVQVIRICNGHLTLITVQGQAVGVEEGVMGVVEEHQVLLELSSEDLQTFWLF